MEPISNPFVARQCENKGISMPEIEVNIRPQYGQCGEDHIIVSMLRALAFQETLDLEKELYCEIGANHPFASSATYLAHVGLGMKGVLVEANPALIPTLTQMRPHDKIINLAVVPDIDAENTEFYISNISELSSVSDTHISNFSSESEVIDQINVSCKTLDQIFLEHFSKSPPLFLSIDTEGLDFEILNGFQFRQRPYIIQVEANATANIAILRDVHALLEENHYAVIASTDVNVIAVDTVRMNGHRRTATLGFTSKQASDLLNKFDVLSLDVFDTILARRTADPTDVFAWIEENTQKKGFAKFRVDAENRARKKFTTRGGEVSLEEIYQNFNSDFDPPSLDEELAAECLFLFANPSLRTLIQTARRQNMRIIAVSDMYLSGKQIEKLLAHNHIDVDQVYSSSDFRSENLGKFNGKLYGRVIDLEGIKASQILHVGDNKVSDLDNAKAAGIAAVYSDVVHNRRAENELFFSRSEPASQTPTARMITGQLSRNIVEGRSNHSIGELFGYQMGGPLIIGFLLHLKELADKNGIDKLFLLERDGCILEECRHFLPEWGIDTRLVPASRRLATLPCFSRGDAKPLLRHLPNDVTEAEFFDFLVIEHPKDFGPGGGVVRNGSEHLDIYQDVIKAQAIREREALFAEFSDARKIFETGGNAAWVDVGWALSCASSLNAALGLDFPCYCIGTNTQVASGLSHEGYLFNDALPHEVAGPILAAVELIEIMFSSSVPSISYLKQVEGQIERVFRPQRADEFVRNGFVEDIRRGIVQFVADTAELVPGLNEAELREMNRARWSSLCISPSMPQYKALSCIPHDRFAGDTEWSTIGDYWEPPILHRSDTTASEVDRLTHIVKRERAHPLKNLRRFITHRALRNLSKIRPFIPEKMARKFARSAQKRDPMRAI